MNQYIRAACDMTHNDANWRSHMTWALDALIIHFLKKGMLIYDGV